VELAAGRRGSFEVTQDGNIIFSRLDTGLFPSSFEEVIELLEPSAEKAG
jgi:hypothetical protein